MKKTVFYLGIFLLMFTAMLKAEVMWDTDLAVRTSTAIEWTSCSAATADGGVLYVWSDIHAGNRNVYAQKVNHAGNLQWTTPVAIVTAEHAQFQPVIIPTSDNNFIITWITSDSQYNSAADIYAQKITSGGQRLWLSEGVPVCTTIERQWNVIGVKDNNGGAFITWSDDRLDNEHIYAQHLDSWGNSLWLTDGICLEPDEMNTARSVIQDGADGCIVSYDNQYSSTRNVYIQRLSSAGNPVWTAPICIGDDASNEMEDQSQLLLINNNEFVVAWQYYSDTLSTAYVQRYTTAGVPVWDSPVCLGGATGATVSFQKAAMTTDGILFAYLKLVETEYILFLQKLNFNGLPLWNEANTGCGAMNLYTPTAMSKLLPDPSGGCYFAWAIYPPDGFYNSDVRTQHFSASGLKTWGADGILLCNDPRNQGNPVMNISANRLFVGWGDNRLGSLGIYYQLLNPNGSLLLEEGGRQMYYGLNSMFTATRFTLPRSNDIVTIWDDDRVGWGSEVRYYMQGINPDGSVDYPDNGIQIAFGDGGNNYLMNAIVTPQDNVVLLWNSSVEGQRRLRMQMVDVQGNPLWGDNGIDICISDASWINNAMLSYDGNDIYVGWTAVYSGSISSVCRIWGQRVSGGQIQWGTAGIMIREWAISDTQHSISLSGLAGRCYVWTENLGFDNSVVAKALLVDPDGSAATGWNYQGSPVVAVQQAPTPAVSGVSVKSFGTGMLITWYIHDANLGYLLRGQLLSQTGAMLWGDNGIPIAEDTGYYYDVQVNPAADLAVVLLSVVVENRGHLIAKAFNGNGNALWTSNLIGHTEVYSPASTLLPMANGSYAVMWERYYGTNVLPGIKYNYLSAQGEVYNNEEGFLLTEAGYSLSTGQACAQGDDGFISWMDGNSYRDEPEEHCNIFVQKINNPYVHASDESLPAMGLVSGFSCYPNPFKGAIAMTWSLKQDAASEMAIYNLKGQKVKTLQKGYLHKGQQKMSWDATDAHGKAVASGVYFCRIEAQGSVISRKLLLLR